VTPEFLDFQGKRVNAVRGVIAGTLVHWETRETEVHLVFRASMDKRERQVLQEPWVLLDQRETRDSLGFQGFKGFPGHLE
jgi:hypothetical protein